MSLNFEEISFQIIAYSGEAKGFAMQAIYEAKKDDFSKAEQFLE